MEGNRKNVLKTMNIEERNSQVIPVSSIFCHFLVFAHHVSQTMKTQKPDVIRLCRDRSKKYHPKDWAMNDDVDMEEEPLVTFGNVDKEFIQDLYNLHISWSATEM